MKCINCAKEIIDGAKSCEYCGYQYGPIEIKMPESGLVSAKRSRINIMPAIKGMVFVGIIATLVFFYIDKKNVNKSALTVVKSLYTAVDKCDGTKFIKCFAPDIVEELKEGGATGEKAGKTLGIIDVSMEEKYGDNWSKKIIYKLISDTEVQITIGDRVETMKVVKIDGKYYISNPEIF